MVITEILLTPLAQSAMITVFVVMMMIAVEYVSVLSRGAFQKALTGARWSQYVGAVLLGALPGCLGPFTVVALYSHRVIPFGAVVSAMIATSGDEAFVMFSLFPATALWLTLGLAIVGLIVGPLTDLLLRDRYVERPCPELVVHEEDVCFCFSGKALIAHCRHPSVARVALLGAVLAYFTVLIVGLLGPTEWNWVRITLLLVALFGGFVVVFAPDHFLDEHLWRHVIAKHVPRLFGWTFSILVVVAVLAQVVDIQRVVHDSPWGILLAAALVGVIPESGPHLVFVALFSDGAVPLSVLVASSIVQDGHGMLPLLAESRRDFILVKVVNLLAGIAVGSLLLSIGL